MSLLHQPSDIWRHVSEQYDNVFIAKVQAEKDPIQRQNLIDLDYWYQQTLPTELAGRGEKYITHEELSKLMTWKLARGKWRPSLQKLVEENQPEVVLAASKRAFRALPDLRSAIEALTVLRGVGPATASAVLAAGAPDQVPFMADESMMAFAGLVPLKYNLTSFLAYADQVKQLTKDLQKQDDGFGWTPHRVELTLWTLQMAKTMKMDKVLSLLETPLKEQTLDADSSKRKQPNPKDNHIKRKKVE